MHLNGGKLSKCNFKGKTNRKWVNRLKVYDFRNKLDPRGWSATTAWQYTCISSKYSNAFFSETAWPIKAKLQVGHPYERGTNLYINVPGHITKMATMSITSKKPL